MPSHICILSNSDKKLFSIFVSYNKVIDLSMIDFPVFPIGVREIIPGVDFCFWECYTIHIKPALTEKKPQSAVQREAHRVKEPYGTQRLYHS